ncbi:hypothetical protein PG989_004242 [Apiospora arundinis]
MHFASIFALAIAATTTTASPTQLHERGMHTCYSKCLSQGIFYDQCREQCHDGIVQECGAHDHIIRYHCFSSCLADCYGQGYDIHYCEQHCPV